MAFIIPSWRRKTCPLIEVWPALFSQRVAAEGRAIADGLARHLSSTELLRLLVIFTCAGNALRRRSPRLQTEAQNLVED